MEREEIANWLSGFEGEVEPPAEVIEVLEELAFAHANPEADWASFAAGCGLDIAVICACPPLSWYGETLPNAPTRKDGPP